MIGDLWETDISGAVKLGIKSIWFNRRNETNFDGDIAEIIYKPNDLIEKLNLT
ncbi:hypothetical protein [Dethiothermospora halolimnae]|uniref:hypothetical protein n=1 Tax=Dethiothermospora halolimnae TaxID=3114390 RepID=UPI003CCBC563